MGCQTDTASERAATACEEIGIPFLLISDISKISETLDASIDQQASAAFTQNEITVLDGMGIL